MRDTLTISRPAELRRTITRSVRKKHMTASEFIRILSPRGFLEFLDRRS